MGKKRIVAKGESGKEGGAIHNAPSSKKRAFERGILYVESTYNNTRLTLTDEKGDAVAASSSGALGFQGAKKGTPFAAAKVGETIAAKALAMGVGSGRESSIRGFVNKGFGILGIKDVTPVPHNGPRPRRARRV